jgi:hypothetical protein
MKISTYDLAHWFNAIRNLPDRDRTRALDAVWSGQLDSKNWLVEQLVPHVVRSSNVYIFGGWIGILASMMFQSGMPVKKIRSIDLDPWCERVADDVNKPYEMDGWRFKSVTADMASYEYQSDIQPDVVINTSSEHVTQEQYDQWWDRIPVGSIVVVQGNDFFSCSEHVRCSKNLQEFETMNHISDSLYSAKFHTNEYTRFMSIWRK